VLPLLLLLLLRTKYCAEGPVWPEHMLAWRCKDF
jgi:hypothetical protein